MAKKSRLFRWFQGLIALSLCLGFQAEALNASAQKQDAVTQVTHSDQTQANWQAAQEIPNTFTQLGENDNFKLYANKDTLAFKVEDKRSGYVWSSNLDEKGSDDRLNKAWTAFAQSGISIDYLDQKAINKRISIANSKTTIDFKPVDQGFESTVTFSDFGISLGVNVTLEAQGARVEIPATSIKEENKDFKLGLVYVYPFMGATREDSIPGYMFIPDGPGSIIRFAKTTKAKNMFYNKYYGKDLGMIAEMPWDSNVKPAYQIGIPVIGMVHGEKQNAYISIVEEGASYGEIQAHPAGIITNFNFLYSAFTYNESYYQATNRSGAGVTTLQPKTNSFNVKIHYRFLTKDDSDYVGMARSYQQYLVEKGILKKEIGTGSDIGLRLEFLGGEKEKVLFWWRSIPMTSLTQMSEILKDLNIANTEVVLYGWQPLGASNMPPKTLKVERSLGNLGELRSVVDQVKGAGGDFYLYLNPQAALWGEAGYSPRNDLAMAITDVNLQGYNRMTANYFFNYNALSNRYSRLSQDVFSKAKAGLALDGISSFLYSDFKKNETLSREEAIKKYQDLLKTSGGETTFYRPNDYLFGFMKAYYDMPISDSGYIYTNEVVPFLEVVLAGYVPYYGPAMNFSSNSKNDLLKLADFGVYPAYFVTHDVTAKILLTNSNWIYTSSYEQWGDDIKQNYQWLNALLGPVKGQEITAREALAAGVFATTYANGKQIVVNYTDQAFSTGGVTVNPQDALLREVAQ